jgi:hypothetical protein
MSLRRTLFTSAFGLAALSAAAALGQETTNGSINQNPVQQGFDISPIPPSRLGLSGKDPWLVGWGSYLVNAATDCSGCHTFPEFLAKGDSSGSNPKAGDPFTPPPKESVTGQLLANFNTSHYLAGGQCFGPFMQGNRLNVLCGDVSGEGVFVPCGDFASHA